MPIKPIQGRNHLFTEKQLSFCREYTLFPENAAQAAKRAGYNDYTHVGAHLLRNPRIQAKIAEYRTLLTSQTKITKDRVLQELAAIAFANLRNFVTVDPLSGETILDLEKISDTDAAALQEISITDSQGRVKIKTSKIRLADKTAALEKLGKHLGLFNDKLEISGGLSLQRLIESSFEQPVPVQIENKPEPEILDVEAVIVTNSGE